MHRIIPKLFLLQFAIVLLTFMLVVASGLVTNLDAKSDSLICSIAIIPKQIHLTLYGVSHDIITCQLTVGTLVDEIGLKVQPDDEIFCLLEGKQMFLTLDATLNDEMKITISRLEESINTVDTVLPYSTTKVYDVSLSWGEKITMPGKNGTKRQTYSITLRDGKVINKVLIGEEVTEEPTDGVVRIGSKKIYTDIDYGRAQEIEVEATAYTHTGNPTATGVYPYKGVIAVDPSVIPLYSEVYIPGYGLAKALDTGGAIKGNRIDLFFEDGQEAIRFGRQTLTIYVLEQDS